MSEKSIRKKEGYPSDITCEQFEKIRPLLEGAKKKTAPRRVDLRDVFNAVLYLLKEGCRWRSLPHDYPPWELVYYYFRVWKSVQDSETQETLLEGVLKKIGWR